MYAYNCIYAYIDIHIYMYVYICICIYGVNRFSTTAFARCNSSCQGHSQANTFYSEEHILYEENTFCMKQTPSVVREHLL